MNGDQPRALSWRVPWRLLGRHLLRQRLVVAWLAGLMLAGIGLELLGPQVIRVFIDRVRAGSETTELVGVGLVFMLVVLVQQGFAIVQRGTHQQVAWRATNNLRSELVRHALALDLGFHTATTPGALLERIEGDVRRLTNFFSTLLPALVQAVLMAVGVLVLLGVEDWRIASVVAAFLLAFVALHRWDQRWAVPHWRQERECSEQLSSFVAERAAGIRDIHTSGADGHVLGRFYRLLRNKARRGVIAEIMTDVGWATSNSFYAVGIGVALSLGAYLYTRELISLGVVYVILHYLQRLGGPMARLGGQLEDLLRARVSIERIESLLATSSRLPARGRQPLPPRGPLSVHLEHVSFDYGGGDPVLQDLSLELAGGETLGVIGPTGSGKTTLSRLLFRFYDAQHGAIRLAGVDIRDLPIAALRRRVALVTQDVQLFSASVRDNVTLFRQGITDGEVEAALETLGLGPWLLSLPRGLDTPVGSNDSGLSAGQAQLLAVARAFLEDPGLVILDEASSRLDLATQRLLETAVDTLLAQRTAVIIAHRLATVRRADAILILDQGRIQEHGAYAALAADGNSRLAQLLMAGGGEELQ